MFTKLISPEYEVSLFKGHIGISHDTMFTAEQGGVNGAAGLGDPGEGVQVGSAR